MLKIATILLLGFVLLFTNCKKEKSQTSCERLYTKATQTKEYQEYLHYKSVCSSSDREKINKLLKLIDFIDNFKLDHHIIKQHECDTFEKRIVLELADCYVRSYLDSALRFSHKALSLSRPSDSIGIADSYEMMGLIYSEMGRCSVADNLLRQSKDIRESLKNEIELSKSYLSIAKNNMNWERNEEETLNYLLHSLSIRNQLNDSAGAAETYYSLGDFYAGVDNQKALEYLNNSLQIKKERAYCDLGAIYLVIGNVKTAQMQFDEARTFYNEALKYSAQVGYETGVASAEVHLANNTVLHWDHETEFNFDTLFHALSIFRQQNNKREELLCLSNIGGIYFGTPNGSESALKYMLSALELAKQLDIPKVILANYNNLAIVYNSQKKYTLSDTYKALARKYADSLKRADNSYNFKPIDEYYNKIEEREKEKRIHLLKKSEDIFYLKIIVGIYLITFGFAYFKYIYNNKGTARQAGIWLFSFFIVTPVIIIVIIHVLLPTSWKENLIIFSVIELLIALLMKPIERKIDGYMKRKNINRGEGT